MWPQWASPVEHFLSLLVSPAALLVRIGLGLACTGSVRAWVSFSPHAPCGCLRLLCIEHSPLSLALAPCPCSKAPYRTRDAAGCLSRLRALLVRWAAGFVTRGAFTPQTPFAPYRRRGPPSPEGVQRSPSAGVDGRRRGALDRMRSTARGHLAPSLPAVAGLRAALAPCGHGRLRGRRAARAGLGRGRSRQTSGGSSSVSTGSVKVMSCPQARRATPVATRPQSVATPRSMAGTSQCSSRPRPSPHPQIPPRRSPHTVRQLSRAGLALSLALVALWGASRGHPPGEYTPCVHLVQGHAWHAHGRTPAVRRCEPGPALSLGQAA